MAFIASGISCYINSDEILLHVFIFFLMATKREENSSMKLEILLVVRVNEENFSYSCTLFFGECLLINYRKTCGGLVINHHHRKMVITCFR